MENGGMTGTVTFLEHSGFVVQCERAVYLFDYHKGTIPEIPEKLPLFVFVSHKHGDHYNPAIFSLIQKHPDTHYIISKETAYLVRKENLPAEVQERILYVKARERYELPCGSWKLAVETLRSTDLGAAFIVTLGKFTVYHAGDLNWWYWTGEDKGQQKQMEKAFKEEVRRLEHRHITLAFLPVDSRLEDTWYMGPDYVMRHADIDRMFPMHCWEDLDVSRRFREGEWAEGYKDKVAEIHEYGEKFRF